MKNRSLYYSLLLCLGIQFLAACQKEQPKVTRTPPAPCASEYVINYFRDSVKRILDSTDGMVGIHAIHLPSYCRFSHNADSFFPLASVCKVPIAMRLLSWVDSNKLDLDSIVRFPRSALRPYSDDLLKMMYRKSYVDISVRELIQLMLQHSENSATDFLLDMAGGPEEVEQQMHDWGFTDMSLDRSIYELFFDRFGLKLPNSRSQWTNSTYRRLRKQSTNAQRERGKYKIWTEHKDVATPRELSEMLLSIFEGEFLSPSSTQFLMETMNGCQTGSSRLCGLLPKGMPVAHKTGTLRGIVNDIGILQMTDSTQWVVSVLVNRSSQKKSGIDARIIGRISDALFHYAEMIPYPKDLQEGVN